MELSQVQKRAGRAWRDNRQAALDELTGPDQWVLVLWRVVRHPCPAAGGASVGIVLREHREPSPEYWVCYCSVVEPLDPYVFPHEDCQGGKMVTAEGQFLFLWKEGHCSGCGLALRSRKGLVLVSDSPSRDGEASPHPGDSRLARA